MKKIPCVRFSRSEKNLDPSIARSESILKSLVLCILLVPLSFPAQAQQPAKVWKIGVLASTSRSLNASREDSLWQGLRQLGYVDGKNIIMEYRYADGQLDRLPQLAAELIELKVDLIIVSGTRAAVAAKQATSTIPIVLAGVALGTGAVRFARRRPGLASAE